METTLAVGIRGVKTKVSREQLQFRKKKKDYSAGMDKKGWL